MSIPTRRLIGCGLAVVCSLIVLLICFPIIERSAQDIRYAWSLRSALDGQIDYIEFQPNTDWPNRRISEPDQIDAVEAWLRSSQGNSRFRSAPPIAVCEMRLVFQDGRVEVIQHSPFRERLSDEGWPDVRGDVRFFFRGFDRSASAEQLAEILDPA